MGIVITKQKYIPVKTEDPINSTSVSYTDGVPVIPYTDRDQHQQVHSTFTKNRHAFTGDVV